ncbi:MAG: hypothetical protein AB1797_04220 [bacterium]
MLDARCSILEARYLRLDTGFFTSHRASLVAYSVGHQAPSSAS